MHKAKKGCVCSPFLFESSRCFTPKSPKGDFKWLIIIQLVCSRFNVEQERHFERSEKSVIMDGNKHSEGLYTTPPSRSDNGFWVLVVKETLRLRSA